MRAPGDLVRRPVRNGVGDSLIATRRHLVDIPIDTFATTVALARHWTEHHWRRPPIGMADI